MGDTIPADDLPTGDAPGLTRYVELASQADVVASTTPVNAAGMAFSVSAGATYLLDGLIRYNGPTISDVKIGFTGPAMASILWSANGMDASGTAMTTAGSLQTVGVTAIGAGNTIALGCSGGLVTVACPRGLFRPSAAGTLQLVWAQNSSNILASSLYPPSFLTLQRVA
ncbi:hypothetical protein [Pseudonocardia sediminis]|uniref:hypothetical protein n=1 Tax=Pseudonocardia sediminis TaxID=1397368 RepID=UPI0010291694|nr:hypothetical protein [Pseudonocardia sediminis]